LHVHSGFAVRFEELESEEEPGPESEGEELRSHAVKEVKVEKQELRRFEAGQKR
jgi:hypothetical protein